MCNSDLNNKLLLQLQYVNEIVSGKKLLFHLKIVSELLSIHPSVSGVMVSIVAFQAVDRGSIPR